MDEKDFKVLRNNPEEQDEQKVTYTAIVETGNGGIDALVQGELPADKIEPKFKAGDWITNGEYTWLIDNVCYNMYDLVSLDGHSKVDDTISHVDEHFHLWTIEDARDGDVLVCEGREYLLFKSFSTTDGRIKLYGWYNGQTNNFHVGTDVKLRREANIYPATKEQRDILFQKMHEAGYGWYANKKELMKISRDKIYTYDIRKNTIEEHEIVGTDVCKFHYFNHDGNRCSYDSRGATVQLLNYRNTDDKYVLVSVDEQSLGWIKESYERVITDFKFKCVNSVLDTIKL